MKSKIEKLEDIGFDGTNNTALYHYITKIAYVVNDLVEAYNSQDQPEIPDRSEIDKYYDRFFKEMFGDTPEEWEKRFKETAERYYEDGSWVDIDSLVGFIKQLLGEREEKAREEGKLEVLEELLEWDTPLEQIGKFMRLQTKMVHMKRDLVSKLTTK